MILIISINDDDSTSYVMDWLSYCENHTVRLNLDKPINNIEVEFTKQGYEIIIDYNNKSFSLSDISSYWLRKGQLKRTGFSEYYWKIG